jgi:cobyrinic acid a,c-diamide synthase
VQAAGACHGATACRLAPLSARPVRRRRERGLDVRGFAIGPAFTQPPPAGDDDAVSSCSGACGAAGGHGDGGAAPALPQGPACIDLGLTPDPDAAAACFRRAAEGADVCIVDGCLSVLDAAGPPAAGAGDDGGAGDGGWSTAAVARALGLPLVLVVDAAATRAPASVAALLRGYAAVGGGAEVAGLFLNRAASDEQVEAMRRGLAAEGVDVPVVGALPQLDGAAPDPHACGGAGAACAGGAALAAEARRRLSADLDALLAVARRAAPPAPAAPLPPPARSFRVVVGVAYDAAFYEYFAQ